MFGIDVLRSPDDRLPDRHAKEVLPANSLLMWVLEGFLRYHADGPPACFGLL